MSRLVTRTVTTPWGLLRVTAADEGVVAVAPVLVAGVRLADDPGDGGDRADLPAAAAPAVAALRAGDCTMAGVAVEGLTAFQRRVLAVVATIPAGSTMTYAEVAAAVGSPRAARAVGGVMARNPVPFLVPCHRVVASGGGLGGYAYGLDVKARVLAAEGWQAA